MTGTTSLAGAATWRTIVPSWGLSAGVHVGLLAWLCVGAPVTERPRGVEVGPDRVVGLVSREFQPGPVETQGGADAAESATTAASDPGLSETTPRPAGEPLTAAAPQTGRDALSMEAPPVALDLPEATPAPAGGLGLGAPPVARRPVDSAEISQVPGGGEGVGETGAGAAPGKASFFGASAKGERIIYVLDASGSMHDYGAIDVARRELKASLERLTPGQRFQVIFYNNTPRPMAQVAGREDLPRATEVNKARARQFIDSQQPQLGTNHLDALELALSQKPDVLFLLTDADIPRLTAPDLDRIRKQNGGKCQIHTIEFGKGGDLTVDDNFLKKLARQNGGQHRYRDVTRFTQGE
jgi:hypothetical protein